MRIVDLLHKDGIALNAKAGSKAEIIDFLIDLQEKSGNLRDRAVYKEEILKREATGTTAVGEGIAIPHAKTDAVARPGLAAVTVPTGVDYEAPDGRPATLLFMIAAPLGGDVHLEVLSRLMTMLMDETFRAQLLAAQDKDAFLKVIDDKEREKYSQAQPAAANTADAAASGAAPAVPADESGYRILAVTACPTGIAHTFMAAEALEKKGRELGLPLKAETNGSGGAKNVLTRAEIAAADGIIIAADKNVEMARFDGKPVVRASVSDGIRRPEELIDRIVNGTATVYHHQGGAGADLEEKEGAGRRIYKHLMNGVSHMLPFVIGGGILIALAFLLDDYSINPSNFGKNTPVAAFFKSIGEAAFNFMMPILAGFIAMSIADRPGLAVGFVGGSLAALGATFASPGGDSTAVSGFIGALLAGFVGGYLVVGLRKLTEKLPKALEGIRPILIYPLLGILLIGVFMCAVNPLVGMLNSALSDGLASMGSTSKILLGAVLGGMMSIDMGGPFNKAAYVFGTASLATQGYDIMAAVMIGGMVPPLVIALCATFFKSRFSSGDRKSAFVNYIMGLCFISEGAIPFAAADPFRVIPSCIVGSAIAGGMSMAFGCTLMAPHGGAFVFPVVGNVGWYILSLIVGSVVGALMLAALKKPVRSEEDGQGGQPA